MLSGRKIAGRPGLYPRTSARIWREGGVFGMVGIRMTGDQLAASGSEHGEQRAFFAELSYWSQEVYDVTFAIPNGGKRDKSVAAGLKAEGVKAGVPDVMVAWPYMRYAGLYIEMKRKADIDKDRKAGTLGKSQSPWHDRLRARGYAVIVCYTWREALNGTKDYFGVPPCD